MGIPNTVNDEVKYAPANLYATEDCLFDIDEGSRLDIYGDVYLNGYPITGGSFDVRNYGAKGDGVTDDTAAIQAALNAAASTKQILSFQPGATYIITATLNVPSNSRLEGNMCTLQNNINLSSGVVLKIFHVTDVSVRNFIIDGNAGFFPAVTEYRHSIQIGHSVRVILRDIRTFNPKGDGFYVGDQTSGLSEDIVINNCIATSTGRFGLSVSRVDGLFVSGGSFSGSDIEPNTADSEITNIRFVGVAFEGNVGSGAGVALSDTPTVKQGGIDYIGCIFRNNSMHGVTLVRPIDVRIIGGDICDNGLVGIDLEHSGLAQNVSILGVTVRRNGTRGLYCTHVFNHMLIMGCHFEANGQVTPSIGIDINTSAGDDLRIVNNFSGGAPQTHGLRTVPGVTNFRASNNTYIGNTTATASYGDDVATRVNLDLTGLFMPGELNIYAAAGASRVRLRTTGDTVDRLGLTTSGALLFSTGALAADLQLKRLAAGVLGMNPQNVIREGSGTTALRPVPATAGVGAHYFDTSLSKPIWCTGTVWVDATGATV